MKISINMPGDPLPEVEIKLALREMGGNIEIRAWKATDASESYWCLGMFVVGADDLLHFRLGRFCEMDADMAADVLALSTDPKADAYKVLAE